MKPSALSCLWHCVSYLVVILHWSNTPYLHSQPFGCKHAITSAQRCLNEACRATNPTSKTQKAACEAKISRCSNTTQNTCTKQILKLPVTSVKIESSRFFKKKKKHEKNTIGLVPSGKFIFSLHSVPTSNLVLGYISKGFFLEHLNSGSRKSGIWNDRSDTKTHQMNSCLRAFQFWRLSFHVGKSLSAAATVWNIFLTGGKLVNFPSPGKSGGFYCPSSESPRGRSTMSVSKGLSQEETRWYMPNLLHPLKRWSRPVQKQLSMF